MIMMIITVTFDKTNEDILKESNTESYWIQFQNIKTTALNMSTECRERKIRNYSTITSHRGRHLKRQLEGWSRNGPTSGQIP
jgi:hypothetical protein